MGSWLKRFLVLQKILEPIRRASSVLSCSAKQYFRPCGDPSGVLNFACPQKGRRSARRDCAPRGHIEELSAKIESCRKFVLASRIAVAGGGIVLASMLLGAIRFDPAAMAAAVAALLGGIVVWGSNGSTAKEAAKELATAEAVRAALIEKIDLRVIS
jgi:hypothetical protein